nr:ABC transporter substrate-binding protein [Methylocella tundrae]
MVQLSISVAIGDYDRTRDLLSGRVPIDGAAPTYLALEPEEIFYRSFKLQEFDVCELSLSSYVLQLASGAASYVALPIFLSRAFRHNGIYIRKSSGIKTAEDLKGRRVGCPEYQLTACVWIRGLLEEQFGVHWSEIEWVRGGIEQPGRAEKLAFQMPSDVRMTDAPADKSLSELLVEGSIDAMIAPRRPSVYSQGNPDIAWLFQDPLQGGQDYFKLTNAFPIMHVLGVRKALVERHPWLASSLVKAFGIAKDNATARLNDTAAPKVTLPFLEEYIKRAQEIFGQDFWPYGVAANRQTLEKFLDYHHRQGLSPKRASIEDLFHPASVESFKI